MKKIYFLALALAAFSANAQTPITQWNFNAGNVTPNLGTGTLTLIGGVTESYALGNDITPQSTDKGLNTSGYPAQGLASGTAGISAMVSTNGYNNIIVSYDRKGSNTASRWEQFEYTIDGSNWVSFGNNNGTLTNVDTSTGVLWPTTTYNLPATANNNANFGVRMVSIFQPSTSAYQAIGTNYQTTGTWRFDNLTVSGTAITAGVKESAIAGLKVFPNPLKGNVLNITSDANATKTVEIFDVLGKQVVNTTTANTSINVSSLTSGVYIVKITEEGKTATKKLVVQ